MDAADRAQETEERVRKVALSKHRPPGPDIDITIDVERCCKECGELIPVKRQVKVPGTKLCVRCQTEYERRLF